MSSIPLRTDPAMRFRLGRGHQGGRPLLGHSRRSSCGRIATLACPAAGAASVATHLPGEFANVVGALILFLAFNTWAAVSSMSAASRRRPPPESTVAAPTCRVVTARGQMRLGTADCRPRRRGDPPGRPIGWLPQCRCDRRSCSSSLTANSAFERANPPAVGGWRGFRRPPRRGGVSCTPAFAGSTVESPSEIASAEGFDEAADDSP